MKKTRKLISFILFLKVSSTASSWEVAAKQTKFLWKLYNFWQEMKITFAHFQFHLKLLHIYQVLSISTFNPFWDIYLFICIDSIYFCLYIYVITVYSDQFFSIQTADKPMCQVLLIFPSETEKNPYNSTVI